MIYIIIILIILIILITPIKIRIIKNDNRSDVDLYISRIFNIHIDFDEFIKSFITNKSDRSKIDIDTILNNINIIKRSKNIIRTISKNTNIKKLTFIVKTDLKNEECFTYITIASWCFISLFQNIFIKNFKSVTNQYYMVRKRSLEEKLVINLECVFNINLLLIIYSTIYNLKDLPKIIKYIKKEVKK